MKNSINHINLLFILFLFSCSPEKKEVINTEAPITIDLVEAYKNKAPIKLSSIGTEVTYVPLESSREAILGGGSRIFVTDSFIVSMGFRKIDVFDRKTGGYIREIGKYGQGPGEYTASAHVESFHENTNTIKARGWDYIIEYNINGKVKRRINKPSDLKNFNPLNENIYVGFYNNRKGTEKRKIGIYDVQQEKIIKTFPNYQECDKRNSSAGTGPYEGWFYRYNNNLFFKEIYDDTLFQVTQENLIPKYVFSSGEYKPPYRVKKIWEEYYATRMFIESSRFLFFRFTYNSKSCCAYFDKETNKCFISDSGKPIRNLSSAKIDAFENDIDNFIPFYPLSINSRNELISAVHAFEIKRWFKENPEKAENLPSHLQKLKNIKETDNPVLMLVKLKE